MKQYRQGDVLLIEIEKQEDLEKQKHKELIILAYGEKTGHMHAILDEKKEVIEYKNEKNNRFFEINETVILSHGLKKEIEEKKKVGKDHSPIKIPKGFYKLIHQREYFPEKIMRVVD